MSIAVARSSSVLDRLLRPGRPRSTDILLWVTVLMAVVICAPFFRYLEWLGDEGVGLHGADRILRGDRIYGEFFEFLPPGSFLIIAAWMQLVGESFASVRVLAIGVIAAIAGLTYVAARLASGNRLLSVLLAVTWVVLSQGPWTVVNHHWLTTALSMSAAVALLCALEERQGSAAVFLAGLFAGTAAIITPTRGVLCSLALVGLALTLRERRQAALRAVAGLSVFPVVVFVYLAATGAVEAAFHDTVVFPAQRYIHNEVVRFGTFTTPHHAAATLFLPVTFVLAGTAAVLQGRALWQQPRFRGAVVLAVIGLLGAFPRPDLAHINFVVPLACPLFALVVTELLHRLQRRTRLMTSAVLIVVCGAVAGYAAAKKIVPVVRDPLRPVSTARGVFLAPPSPWAESVAALVALISQTSPDDGFVFYPYSPMLPYLTARHHVAPHDVMLPGHTTREQYRNVCVRAIRDARWIVIDRSWSDPRVLRAFYPSMVAPDPPEKRGLEAALRLAFDHVIYVSPFHEFRRRSENASDTGCARI